jgi:hypothetical protein
LATTFVVGLCARYPVLDIPEHTSIPRCVARHPTSIPRKTRRANAPFLRREEQALSLTDSHPSLSPSNIYDFLANLFYARRSKMNPVWNAVLVGGWDRVKAET